MTRAASLAVATRIQNSPRTAAVAPTNHTYRSCRRRAHTALARWQINTSVGQDTSPVSGYQRLISDVSCRAAEAIFFSANRRPHRTRLAGQRQHRWYRNGSTKPHERAIAGTQKQMADYMRTHRSDHTLVLALAAHALAPPMCRSPISTASRTFSLSPRPGL